MKLVILTRTSRPSGARVAECLLKERKGVVAIIAEERSQLLKKNGGILSIVRDSFKRHGFEFTLDRILESINIKLHIFLRRLLPRAVCRSMRHLSIEELVMDHNIPYVTVRDHNSKETEDLIRGYDPDLIVITNTRLIRKNILDTPRFGCLNLHLSQLPKYAGLNSIFWALFHGEKEIGATVHFVSEELDRGDIVLQKSVPVFQNDTEKSLYKKALELGTVIMSEAVTLVEEGRAKPLKQDMKLASYHKWPTRAERRLLKRKLKRRSRGELKRPLRILHIITRLVKGGAQENTLLTVSGLRNKGYKVVLVSGPTCGQEGELESYARRMKFRLIIIPELVRPISPWKDMVAFVRIFNLIKRCGFDLVHTHTSKAGIIGRFAARLGGVPAIVHTPHGHIFHSYFGPFKTRFLLTLERTFSNLCDKIITLTDRCKQEHIELRIAPPEKFTTIPSGIQMERFNGNCSDIDEIKRRLNIPNHRKVVGTVSRLESIKGVGYFVSAMQEVLSTVPETHFVIVGDGSQRRKLEMKAESLGIKENVTFTGIRDDVPDVIAALDLFVLSSLNEGMGRVLVEAGVMAKPVVATRVSGIPELVEDGLTGILVEPKNTRDLARGITEILSDSEMAKSMGAKARLKMTDNFSARMMVDKIELLYKKLLS